MLSMNWSIMSIWVSNSDMEVKVNLSHASLYQSWNPRPALCRTWAWTRQARFRPACTPGPSLDPWSWTWSWSCSSWLWTLWGGREVESIMSVVPKENIGYCAAKVYGSFVLTIWQDLPGLGCRYSVVLVIISNTALAVTSTFYSQGQERECVRHVDVLMSPKCPQIQNKFQLKVCHYGLMEFSEGEITQQHNMDLTKCAGLYYLVLQYKYMSK